MTANEQNTIQVGSTVRRRKIDRNSTGDVKGVVIAITGEKAKVEWSNWYGPQVSSIAIKNIQVAE